MWMIKTTSKEEGKVEIIWTDVTFHYSEKIKENNNVNKTQAAKTKISRSVDERIT
jgi:hypothetical protein